MAIIRRKALQAFLERPREDYRLYKTYSDGKLDQMMEELPVRPPIWHKLKHHQKVCFIIGAKLRRFVFFNDTGTGKTLLAISLIRFFRKMGLIRRALVLVPNRINKEEWVAELMLHSENSSYEILDGSSAQKWQQLEEGKTLFVFETYAGLVRMVSEDTGRGKLRPDRALVKKFKGQFQALVCDESVAIKNRGSLSFRIVRQIAKSAKACFPMTGTPFNRDPSEIWAQAFVVDDGKVLGETLGLFRATFFEAKTNYWGRQEYKFKKDLKPLLTKMLSGVSIAYEADASTLPKVSSIKKYVSMPEENRAYYERMRRVLLSAEGNYREIKNAFLRMRQISSGFVGFQDDETGAKARIEFPSNPKLELLLSIIASIREDHKVIIFYEFTYSGLRIVKELGDIGVEAVQLYSGTKDLQKTRQKFLKERKTRVLVLQNQFGVGLNVQVAKYGIYYESPVSAIIRKQTTRRVERQHSAHSSVGLYDLLMRDTWDDKILKYTKEGGDLLRDIIRGRLG